MTYSANDVRYSLQLYDRLSRNMRHSETTTSKSLNLYLYLLPSAGQFVRPPRGRSSFYDQRSQATRRAVLL